MDLGEILVSNFFCGQRFWDDADDPAAGSKAQNTEASRRGRKGRRGQKGENPPRPKQDSHEPRMEVWSAITDPEQRVDWFGATVIDGRVGGTIEMVAEGPPVSRDQRTITGRILVWDPPRVFEHEWNQPLVEKGVVRYELAPEGDATILTFTHRGLSVPNAQGYISGTHAFLDRLTAHLDGAKPPDWRQRFAEAQQTYYSVRGDIEGVQEFEEFEERS